MILTKYKNGNKHIFDDITINGNDIVEIEMVINTTTALIKTLFDDEINSNDKPKKEKKETILKINTYCDT